MLGNQLLSYPYSSVFQIVNRLEEALSHESVFL